MDILSHVYSPGFVENRSGVEALFTTHQVSLQMRPSGGRCDLIYILIIMSHGTDAIFVSVLKEGPRGARRNSRDQITIQFQSFKTVDINRGKHLTYTN